MSGFVPGIDIISIASTFLTQVGARHLVFNFSDVQKKIISLPGTQALIMFGMFYMGTRSIVFATTLLIVYYLFLLVLANEKHPMNVIPRTWLPNDGKRNLHSAVDMYYENLNRMR